MIYALIALSIAGVVIALLAIIAYNAIAANSRWSQRAQDLAAVDVKRQEEAETLKAENGKLQQELHYVTRERDALAARSTALQEALEAKPTLPAKRVVRKNAQTTE